MANDGLKLLKYSPSAYQQVLIRFRVCHDLCAYSGNDVFTSEVRDKVDQCAVDFRHMSIETATLADRISSVWCKTCLLFFKNFDKVTKPEIIFQKISDQARDLSEGFKGIAEWCRLLAGRFHDVGELATQESEDFQKNVDRAVTEANQQAVDLKTKLEQLQISAKGKRDVAEKWSVRASYPIIGIFWNSTAMITNEHARNAEDCEWYANRECADAKKQLQQARSKQDKAKKVAREVSMLVSSLKDVENLCVCTAAFWQMESDKFGSFGTNVKEAQDFAEIGLGSEVCAELIEWLEETKGTFEKYHATMTGVNAALNFSTNVQQYPFPSIDLPNLGLKLN